MAVDVVDGDPGASLEDIDLDELYDDAGRPSARRVDRL
jgi:hypothetical protein